MELRQLEAFQRVAQLRSFTRAAGELRRAQSSVTEQVRSLERSLGVPLFERQARAVRLTEAGERLAEYADQILGLVEEARGAVLPGGIPSGKLSIGTMESLTSYRLVEPLLELQRRYPRLQVALRPSHGSTVTDGVREGRYDAGFLMQTDTHHPGLTVVVLFAEPLVVLAAPDHPLVGAPEVTLDDLRAEQICVTESGCDYRDEFEQLLADGVPRPVHLFEFGTIEGTKRTVAAGHMLTLLPRVTVEAEVQAGTLAVLPFEPPFSVYTQVVWRKDRWVTPTLATFVDFMSRRLKDQAARPLGSTVPAPAAPAATDGG